MRVSTNHQYTGYSAQISSTSERIAMLQGELSSGKRINTPSDDPLGAAQVIVYQSALSANSQYAKNILHASSFLKTTESTLSEVSKILNDVKANVVQGANGTSDQAARTALATEVQGSIDQLLNLANQGSYNNQQIFSGQKTDTKPFTVSAGVLTYQGDSGAIKYDVSSTQSIQVNLPGQPIFSDIYNVLKTVHDDLENGKVDNLSKDDLANLQKQMDNLSSVRAGVGQKIQELTSLDSQTSKRNDDLKTWVSNTQDIDITKAITDLQTAQVAYQASLTAASKSFGLSLMDFIRGG